MPRQLHLTQEFFGIWDEKEFREFEAKTKDFERIDEEDWKWKKCFLIQTATLIFSGGMVESGNS